MEFLLLLPVAVFLDLIFGDPDTRLHPVRWIGTAVDGGRNALRRTGMDGYVGGLLLLLTNLLFFPGVYLVLYWFLIRGTAEHTTAVLNGFALYACISFRSLLLHASSVVQALREEEVDDARDAVHPLIERDADSLDTHGVGRATVEALAGGYVNALVAPLFWFLAGATAGLWLPLSPGACGVAATIGHRVVNTLDVMVGYRTERFRTIGWASARTDDLLNFLPARMAVPLLFLAGMVVQLDVRNGAATWLRDRLTHPSPNAGQTESFVAGLLHVSLGGPGVYPHGVVETPWMGNGTPKVTEVHVKHTVQLILVGGVIAYVCAFLLSIGIHRIHLFLQFAG